MPAYRLNFYRRSPAGAEAFVRTEPFDADDDKAARIHMDETFSGEIEAFDRVVLVGEEDMIIWEKGATPP